MTDTDFANVLAAYKIIGPHPGLSTAQIQALTDVQMWTLLCNQFLGQIVARLGRRRLHPVTH